MATCPSLLGEWNSVWLPGHRSEEENRGWYPNEQGVVVIDLNNIEKDELLGK